MHRYQSPFMCSEKRFVLLVQLKRLFYSIYIIVRIAAFIVHRSRENFVLFEILYYLALSTRTLIGNQGQVLHMADPLNMTQLLLPLTTLIWPTV